MYSPLAKAVLCTLAFYLILLSCSRDKSEPLWEPKSYDNNYNGGLHPVWITLKEPVTSIESISWQTNYSKIAYRNHELNAKDLIIADTAYLYWETPPPVTIKLDSTRVSTESQNEDGTSSTTTSWRLDTTYLYIDTIFAIIDGYIKSEPILIEIKNILPRIASISVGGVTQPGDSVLTIAALQGETLDIEIRLEKVFEKKFSPIVEIPKILGDNIILKQQSDSLYLWQWTVPRTPIDDSSTYIRIKDSGGYGERLYKIHLVAYNDFGSVWAASERELVKYSPTGTRVVRISDNFDYISDIAVNSNRGELFVIDQYKNIFAVYDRYGNSLYKSDSLLKNPTSIALDITGERIWIADGGADSSRLRAFAFSGGNIEIGTSAEYSLSGQIKGLSADQYKREFLWFSIPESDAVGFVRYSDAQNRTPEYVSNKWRRPSMVSYDPTNGLAWVADSARVLAINENGKELAIISGFNFVSAVSAGGGSVWVSDVSRGRVYRFKESFDGGSNALSLTPNNGTIIDGFSQPSYVSAFVSGGSTWVMDTGRGEAVLVDSLRRKTAVGIGLRPVIGKTIQISE